MATTNRPITEQQHQYPAAALLVGHQERLILISDALVKRLGQVFECVLKACVGARDGFTALEVIRRQAAEPKRAQGLTPPSKSGETGEVSGGPPDRRCWCLAAEALGRAGMVEEVRVVYVASRFVFL